MVCMACIDRICLMPSGSKTTRMMSVSRMMATP